MPEQTNGASQRRQMPLEQTNKGPRSTTATWQLNNLATCKCMQMFVLFTVREQRIANQKHSHPSRLKEKAINACYVDHMHAPCRKTTTIPKRTSAF